MSWILGAITGIAEFAGAATTEAVGSEAIGQVVGGTIAGEITGAVEGAIDTATSTVIDTIFGANAYENKKKQFYNSIEEARALGLFSGDVGNEAAVLQTIKNSNFTEDDLINQIHNFGRDFTEEVVKQGATLDGPIEDNSTVGNILATLSTENPVYFYLVDKLLTKSSEIVVPKDDPEYQAIAAVYNGKSNNFYEQLAKTTFENGNTVWTEVDETGQAYSWYFPLMNNYTPKPAVFGRYVGLSSPNDGTPIRGVYNNRVVESLIDKSAFFHDIDYSLYGMFNKTADYKLISRASQNMDKMIFPGEKLAAQVAVNYFSTLGTVMRNMMGDQEQDPIIKKLFKDIFDKEITTEEIKDAINTKVNYGSGSDQLALAQMILNLEISID